MNKRSLTIGGIVALALLLAGAAFVGGRLLNGQGLTGGPEGGEVQVISPTELPQTRPDAQGVFDHREDKSIFVSTGDASIESSHDGPIVEVVVTAQTTIYYDVTMRQYGTRPEGQQIQQVVEPGSLDDVGESSTIALWGTQTGDRIIADVLVYESPALVEKP